jgi:hypothetical protein
MAFEQENELRSDKLKSKHKIVQDLSLYTQLSFGWHAI